MLVNDFKQYIFWPGIFIVLLFEVMTIVLTFGALFSACTNLTTNELNKQKKYDYLHSAANSKSIFNKGVLYNLKYYFHLIEPPPLETEYFESVRDYTV